MALPALDEISRMTVFSFVGHPPMGVAWLVGLVCSNGTWEAFGVLLVFLWGRGVGRRPYGDSEVFMKKVLMDKKYRRSR